MPFSPQTLDQFIDHIQILNIAGFGYLKHQMFGGVRIRMERIEKNIDEAFVLYRRT